MKTNKSLLSIAFDKSNRFALIGWTCVFVLAFYFLNKNAIRYFNPSYKIYTPAFRPYAPFIVVHVAGGMIALLIGPLQFFPAIRKKYPAWHRSIGKTYLLCIIIAGVTATYLATFHNILQKKDFIFGTGTLAMAFAWFITAGMAFWAIKKRNFSQHREWMVRSYVLTANFILFRLIYYGLLSIDGFPFKTSLRGFTAWAGWALPLLITEVILQARKINTGRN